MSNTVPEGWTIATLEQIALDKKGAIVDGPFGSNLKTSDYVAEGVPVLQGKNITHDKFRWSDVRFITPAKAKDLIRSSVRVGDILLIKIGSVGYSAIVDNLNGNNFAIIPANLMKLSVDESRNSTHFVHHYLTSPEGRGRIIDAASSTAQPALSLSTVKKFKIPRPPLPEQQKIAAILSSVDDVIEKTRAQIDKLKDLKTGMMQELLSKGIGHTEFKDSPLGRIPEAWAVLPLSELVSRDRPITYGIVQTGENLPNGIPCVRVVDLMRPALSTRDMIRTSKKISHQYKRTLLQEGDIMFALRGEIGHVRLTDESLVGANLTRGVALISPNNAIIPRYLLWALRSPVVRSIIMDGVNGSALQEIPLGNLRNVLIPVPPEEEQARLADTLDALEQSKTQSERKLDTYRNLKKALMQDLLTGKVRVKVDQKESAVA